MVALWSEIWYNIGQSTNRMETNIMSDEMLTSRRAMTAEEEGAVLGESFVCPYCRTVSKLGEVMAVAVSSELMGDSVLGEYEARRFLPSHFTKHGLAIDACGGVCTLAACPHCHMAVPQLLLETEQMSLAVIGAVGAGKSVFLASSMWECRQKLSANFGLVLTDLEPAANRWINAYEEKLFFQSEPTELQQIEKTELQDPHVSRMVKIRGENVLLPLPSFFYLQRPKDETRQSLVIYDSAGEHFRAGAPTQNSMVTLNMLTASAIFFMFDPSAEPRFRSMLDMGKGTAQNNAQRQDILLSEMASRLRRYMGTKQERRLSKPLIFGVSKADLLRHHLPLGVDVYREGADGKMALDLGALRKVSDETEALLKKVVPDVVATVHGVANEVWFVPVSALGHNPMKEGIRPCDIHPICAELPLVLTLAHKGLIPTVG